MKRNECGTEEDLLPYYALFGLPRKLRTLEKTLESIPKAGRRMGYFCDAWLLLTQVAGAQETV